MEMKLSEFDQEAILKNDKITNFEDCLSQRDKAIKSFKNQLSMTEEAIESFKTQIALMQYFTNWIRKSSSFIPISKYFSVKCLKS